MTKTEKLAALTEVYTTKKRNGTDEDIVVFNDKSAIAEDIKAIQFKLNDQTGTFELDYDIMRDACYAVSELDENGLESADANELAEDTASVYTAARLSYLNVNNQAEISDILNEYDGLDIADAAAEWYQRQVSTAVQMLIDWVLEDEDAI